MYETRLVGGGGKTTGLGGSTRGPLDLLINGLVGFLIVYLAWTVVEPFWLGAVEQSREVKLQADMKVLTDALSRYKVQRGEYEDTDLKNLSAFLSNIPVDPWGQPYQIDPLFRRILSGGDDKAIGGVPDAKEGLDDVIHYYQHPWRMRVVVEQPGGTVPFELVMDGTDARPVAGDFLPGVRHIVQAGDPPSLVYAADSGGGNLDIARRGVDEAEANWLVGGPGQDDQPAVAPNGRHAYFRSVRGAPKPLIYRVPLGGGAPEKVTRPLDKWDFPDWDGDHAPSVSPSKGHLAFHSARTGNANPYICFISKGNPLGPVKVLKSPYPSGRFPTWGPDGKSVYFLDSGGSNLMRIPFPPKRHERVLTLGGAAQGFALSPDAEFVVTFAASGDGELTVHKLGTRKSRVVFTGQGRIVGVSWIP